MNHEIDNFANPAGTPGVFPSVTLQMVRSRTVELAIGAGRSPIEISQHDYERAKRELTGETDSDRQLAVLYPGL